MTNDSGSWAAPNAATGRRVQPAYRDAKRRRRAGPIIEGNGRVKGCTNTQNLIPARTDLRAQQTDTLARPPRLRRPTKKSRSFVSLFRGREDVTRADSRAGKNREDRLFSRPRTQEWVGVVR